MTPQTENTTLYFWSIGHNFRVAADAEGAYGRCLFEKLAAGRSSA